MWRLVAAVAMAGGALLGAWSLVQAARWREAAPLLATAGSPQGYFLMRYAWAGVAAGCAVVLAGVWLSRRARDA